VGVQAALLSDAPRNATVAAVEATECARLHRDDFVAMLGKLGGSSKFRQYDSSGHELGTKPETALAAASTHQPAAEGDILASDVEPALFPTLKADSFEPLVEKGHYSMDHFELGPTLGMGAFGRVYLVKVSPLRIGFAAPASHRVSPRATRADRGHAV
jgi:hypothetical protein